MVDGGWCLVATASNWNVSHLICLDGDWRKQVLTSLNLAIERETAWVWVVWLTSSSQVGSYYSSLILGDCLLLSAKFIYILGRGGRPQNSYKYLWNATVDLPAVWESGEYKTYLGKLGVQNNLVFEQIFKLSVNTVNTGCQHNSRKAICSVKFLCFNLYKDILQGKKKPGQLKKQVEWHIECTNAFLNLLGLEESWLDTRSVILKSFLLNITWNPTSMNKHICPILWGCFIIACFMAVTKVNMPLSA